MEGLQEALEGLGQPMRAAVCERGKGLRLAAVEEFWDFDDPYLRRTSAFIVCEDASGEAWWSRVSFLRRWPAPLVPSLEAGPIEMPSHRTRLRKVSIQSGLFPRPAQDDLQWILGHVAFWGMNSEFHRGDDVGELLRVIVLFGDVGGRAHQVVVGGEACGAPRPERYLSVFAMELIHPWNEVDPVGYIADLRKARE